MIVSEQLLETTRIYIYCNLKIACNTFSPKTRCIRTSPPAVWLLVVSDHLPWANTNSLHFGWSLTWGLTEYGSKELTINHIVGVFPSECVLTCIRNKTYPGWGGGRIKVVIKIFIACWCIWLSWIPGSSVKWGAWRIVGRRHWAIMRGTTSCKTRKPSQVSSQR